MTSRSLSTGKACEGRRLKGLQCTGSADIRSGYVFRLDASSDPRVDPVQSFEENDISNEADPKISPQFQKAFMKDCRTLWSGGNC